MTLLPEMGLVSLNQKKIQDDRSVFVIEPLLPGFGTTLGTSLRRVLLSSLEGYAIHAVKINDIVHEFSPIKGVKEDAIEVILNLKSMRVKLLSDEPVTIKLTKKGAGKVMAKDFHKNVNVEIVDPDHQIATLDKAGELEIEAIITKGRGYFPVEAKQDQKLPIGWILVDSNFSPIKKINVTVENTRVGQRTDYNQLVIDLTSDKTITPAHALQKAATILLEHYSLIASQSDDSLVADSGKDSSVKKQSNQKTGSKKS